MPDAILRVTLTRGPGARGYTPKVPNQPTVVMTLHPAPSLENPGRVEPDHVVVSDSGERSAGFLQDDEQNLARHGARRGGGKGRG